MPKETKTDRKIKRYQALIPYLDLEYRGLLAAFELLKLTTTKELQDKFIRAARTQGFAVVADALLARCIIVMHRLLDAGKETSPSLCYLARPLLAKYQKEYAKVVGRLEELHPSWHRLVLRWKSMQSYHYLPKHIFKPSQQRIVKSVQEQRMELRQAHKRESC